MFSALGRGVKKNDDGSITAKLEFMDDTTGKSLGFETFTVGSLKALQQAAQQSLEKFKRNEQDATLNAAIVGQLIAQV